jgi:hypothetical protein
MGVTLEYPATGTPTLSVELPYPSSPVGIDPEPNQKEYRAGSGHLWTCKIGPTIYKIRRTWQALNETEIAALFAFLEGIGFAYNHLRYCYIDAVDGQERSARCRLIEAPSEQMVHISNRDVTLVFEQYTHHDALSEATAGDTDGAILIDDDTPLGIDDDDNMLGFQ